MLILFNRIKSNQCLPSIDPLRASHNHHLLVNTCSDSALTFWNLTMVYVAPEMKNSRIGSSRMYWFRISMPMSKERLPRQIEWYKHLQYEGMITKQSQHSSHCRCCDGPSQFPHSEEAERSQTRSQEGTSLKKSHRYFLCFSFYYCK